MIDSLAERTGTNVDGQSDVLKPFADQPPHPLSRHLPFPQKLHRDQMKQTINLNAELLHVISSHINTPYTESNQATHKRVSAAHSSGL